MAWDQLSINKPHLVYIILGGFTSIFMLCSLFIKEKLYIGEATVATICGVIFGPHAANLIDPQTWGNTDMITIEFSRIVLVVQCFAVGVELPKSYMERHWKSVVFLLFPVMTFGWLITSLFIWWMVEPLTWLESLVCAACVTATDPVLASSVVGKGKFAKRVPKHLRDLLSAESGCNDGMAFPFVYLALYLVRYHLEGRETVFHWFCYTIMYECIFGAFYGVCVGYIGRHAIKWAEKRGLIDRESFLVFYFVLALFCAGSGSLLGLDDLLVGFAAGVGFSNDGWFSAKTEESHVSNVIDLLINLAYFVFFGTIIPWDQYNAPEHGLTPWRLVVIAILVIFFRRMPIMLICKPFIPDIKTWREALFAGHFGPIGVGAIFVAILARAELETGTPEPLDGLPPPGSKDFNVIYLVWPITTFLVIASILVHGSSIAVFTLGKRINTLSITLSYTQDNERGAAWMNRLPRITSQSKSMARQSSDYGDDETGEKLDIPPGELPPIGIPKLHLRRQKEEDYPEKPTPRSSSHGAQRRRKKRDWDSGIGPGGPVSESAIMPARRSEPPLNTQESGSDTLADRSEDVSPASAQRRGRDRTLATGSPTSSPERDQLEMEEEAEVGKRRRSESVSPGGPADIEAYEEGDEMVLEDEEGNVLDTITSGGMSQEQKKDAIEDVRDRLTKDKSGEFSKHKHRPHHKTEGEELEHDITQAMSHPEGMFKKAFGFNRNRDKSFSGPSSAGGNKKKERPAPERKRGPAHAYQFGNTVIVEDEDGEVIKKYTLPAAERPGAGERRGTLGRQQMRQGIKRMGTWAGVGRGDGQEAEVPATSEGAAELLAAGSTAQEGAMNVAAPKVVKKTDKTKRRGSNDSEDDGLRMVIAHTDRYGLTGLQKKVNKSGTETVELGSGQRLSKADFIRQMQQMDPKSKIHTVEGSDAPETIKREVRREARAEEEANRTEEARPRTEKVSSSSKISSANRNLDTAEMGVSTRRPETSKRSQTATSSYFAPQRPQVEPTTATLESTAEREEAEEEDEEDVPSYDVRGSISRHGSGPTAAEARRRRLASQSEDKAIMEENDAEEPERETAAEQRRRLAALGQGNDSDTSDSDDDDEGPRETEHAVPEPETEMPAQSGAEQRRMRVQWGGESGRDRDRETGQGHTHGAGSKIKGFLKKNVGG